MSKEQVGKVTLADIEKLRDDIKNKKLKTIGEWKKRVKQFAIEFGLTDREAIDIERSNK